MKTIARFETARFQRNAPRPAPVVDQIMAEERAAAFAGKAASAAKAASMACCHIFRSTEELSAVLLIRVGRTLNPQSYRWNLM
jgi:hypothetical protein